MFRVERARLLEVLQSLDASDWQRPTRCPGWSWPDAPIADTIDGQVPAAMDAKVSWAGNRQVPRWLDRPENSRSDGYIASRSLKRSVDRQTSTRIFSARSWMRSDWHICSGSEPCVVHPDAQSRLLGPAIPSKCVLSTHTVRGESTHFRRAECFTPTRVAPDTPLGQVVEATMALVASPLIVARWLCTSSNSKYTSCKWRGPSG